MTRRIQPCLTCNPLPRAGRFILRRGYTRHDNRICAACRKGVPTAEQSAAITRAYRGRAA